ncbi:unnamed protein product [Urochloa humidicola]
MRYAPDDTDTEKKKIYYYKRGLHRGMKLNLEAHDFTSLHQLIGKALRVEKVRMECENASLRDRKRKVEQFRSGPCQRPRLNAPQPQQQRQRSYPPPAQQFQRPAGEGSSGPSNWKPKVQQATTMG